ncbi:hypothetical protein BCR39DRAFT_540974 [Naematelia encephala]|uniref:VWFA domain-containing protein n=1 Tax=Naematelia encephala TaxID=71784 RepID=A0A1Y2AX66_9TREE|nr:hypothetical protein BCR39DRAFT_540974 [Naematelia encephala]
MPLESCMLVLDNSEYMRNGDYTPTRYQAQAQAVSTVFSAKTDSNPESAVGVMTMAGKSPSLLVTPTNDIGKLLSALGKSTIGGTSDLLTSVQIAQLALKHRENKNQRQRIVVFVGSPIEDDQDSLVKLGKKLRKNNVLIDVVTFGDEGMSNDDKLNALVEAAGGGESHLVSIPPGPHLLSDVILTSPILFDPDRPTQGAAESGGFGDEIDPSLDPELAMAIRMSMQEEEERRRREAGEPSSSSSSDPIPTTNTSTTTTTTTSAPPVVESATTLPDSITQPLTNANDPDIPMVPGDSGELSAPGQGDEEMDEDEMLRRAMALSRGEAPDEDILMAEEEGDAEEDEDEDAAIARAIAMSLEENKDKKDEA